jgi:hypothetical protein
MSQPHQWLAHFSYQETNNIIRHVEKADANFHGTSDVEASEKFHHHS